MKPWQQPTRTLLFTTRPVPAETPVSYLRRLAVDNDVEILALVQSLADVRRVPHHTDDARFNPVALARLAALTRRASPKLQRAMPSLQVPHAVDDPEPRIRLVPAKDPTRPYPACRTCMARRAIREPVVVHLPAHLHLCRVHGRWLRGHQLDVAAVPELHRAQHLHERLARRHPPDRLDQTLREAAGILRQWNTHPTLAQRWADRRRLLAPAGGRSFLPPYAPRYPELTALASLIASPHWTRVATASARGEDHFLDEANRRLGLDTLHRAPEHDPLLRWLHDHRKKARLDPQQFAVPLRRQTLALSQWN